MRTSPRTLSSGIRERWTRHSSWNSDSAIWSILSLCSPSLDSRSCCSAFWPSPCEPSPRASSASLRNWWLIGMRMTANARSSHRRNAVASLDPSAGRWLLLHRRFRFLGRSGGARRLLCPDDDQGDVCDRKKDRKHGDDQRGGRKIRGVLCRRPCIVRALGAIRDRVVNYRKALVQLRAYLRQQCGAERGRQEVLLLNDRDRRFFSHADGLAPVRALDGLDGLVRGQ